MENKFNLDCKVKSAFMDLMDGIYNIDEIKAFTALPDERCKVIYDIHQELKREHEKTIGLKEGDDV